MSIKQIFFRIRHLFRDILILTFALTEKRTPWFAKVLILIVFAYAISPIDLIPDIILILGFLDDFIILQILVYICKRLIPDEVITDCSQKVNKGMKKVKRMVWIAGSFVILLWVLLIGLLIYYI